VRLATQILDAIRARMSVGTASALDVAEQESIVATQKATIPPLEQQATQARVSLAVLNGVRPEGFKIKANGLDGVTVPEIAPNVPSTVLLRRPDLASAEANLRSAEANVEAARMAFLPTLSLTAKNGVESRTLATLLRSDTTNPGLTGDITAPIFDGGTLNADFALEKGIRDELAATYRKTALTALSDVEIALSNVKTSRDQEKLQYEAVIASRRAYAISEGRLKAGTIDSVTLLTVEQNLFQAEDALITARLARLSAALSLIQALGGGFAVQPTSPVAQRLFGPFSEEMRPAQ
jgi:outer membrane protein, multidrug efflux system